MLTLTAHTVTTESGALVAGHLVRCAGQELGYIYRHGPPLAWHWVTPNRANFGHRVTQEAACEALRSIAQLGAPRQVSLFGEAVAPSAPRQTRRQPPPRPEPEPVRVIDWNDMPALDTAKLAADIRTALGRYR